MATFCVVMPEIDKPGKMPEEPATGSPNDIPQENPLPQAAEPDKPAETSKSGATDHTGVIGVIVFWVLVFGFVGYGFFAARNPAQVFLEASSRQPIQVTGLVLFNGAPMSKGTVHVVFDDPKKNRYLGGAILTIAEDGKFATDQSTAPAESAASKPAPPQVTAASTPAPLRVTATFNGQQPAENKDKAATAVSGTATLYLNYPPPAGRWTLGISVVVSAILAIGLITLFTGDLTRRKSRILFSITYIMTFMSLAVPIGTIVLVSKSQYAVEMMEEAPVGLIKGTAKGVQSPQWLVNVGGAVTPADKTTLATNQTARQQAIADASPSVAAASTPQPTPAVVLRENVRPDELRQTPGFAMVQGGLAVPFYVIILAMLGAGINMTKKVPLIQMAHDIEALPEDTQSMVAAALKAPVAALVSSGPSVRTPDGAKAMAGIRKDLINTYMGLISAPFLAIAVYYLLQVIATNIAEPVLVLVAFATGFISDSIVTAITNFASEMISKADKTRPALGGEKEGKKGIAAGRAAESSV